MAQENQDQSRIAAMALAVVLGVFVLAFFSTINGVVVRWFKFDESYSHGLLVLGISVYLFGRNIKALWPLRIVPNYLALVGLLGASGLWGISHALHLQVLEEVLLPIILWFGFCSVLGWRQSQTFIVPVGF